MELDWMDLLSLPAEPTPGADNDRITGLIDRMIDWRLLNPAGRWTQFAEIINTTPSSLHRLARTDAFRVRYNERREAITGAVVDEVLAQTQGMMDQALDRVTMALDDGTAGAEFALKAFDVAAKMLGVGVGNSPAAKGGIRVDRALVLQGTLAQSREAIREMRLLDQPRLVDEVPAAA